jgi:hypothetical protein
MGLSRHVRLDDLVSDVVAPAAQGASCPAMAAPQALPHGWKCGEQTRGTFALHPLDEATDLDMRGERAHPMAMLWRAMPVEDIAPRLLTCFADTSAAPFRHLATQPFVALLGDPDIGRWIANVVWEPWRESHMRQSVPKIG